MDQTGGTMDAGRGTMDADRSTMDADGGTKKRMYQPICPRCYKPLDRLDANSQHNPATYEWEHRECLPSPRTHTPSGPTKRP